MITDLVLVLLAVVHDVAMGRYLHYRSENVAVAVNNRLTFTVILLFSFWYYF